MPRPTENTRPEHQEEQEEKETKQPTPKETTQPTEREKQHTKQLEQHLAENPPTIEEADHIEDLLTRATKHATQKETPEQTPTITPTEIPKHQKEQIEQHLAKHAPTEKEADKITEIINKAADTTQEPKDPTPPQYLGPPRDTPEQQTPEQLAETINQFYRSYINPLPITHTETLPHTITQIQEHRHEIEHHLNNLTPLESPYHVLRVATDKQTLYIWRQDTNPDHWLNLYTNEYIYLNTTQTKTQLLDKAQQHLNTSQLGLSRIINQLSETPVQFVMATSKLGDLTRHSTYLRGSTLKFTLDATNQTLTDIQPHIRRIGRDTSGDGRGGIHNPRFPTGEKLNEFRARAYSIIACDGHIHFPTRSVTYCDNDPERLQYVKRLFKNTLGNIHIKDNTRPGGRTRLIMAVPVGRLLEKWGMPVGDKILQPTTLPPTIRHGTPRTRRAYLEELTPEDGGFYTHKTSGRFQWKRGTILNAGPKTQQYGFTPKTTPQQEEFIKQHGKTHTVNIRDEEPRTDKRIRWPTLEQLSEAKNPLTRQTAQQLQTTILQNPPHLMADEIQLCKSLGIKITPTPQTIRLYDNGRVSVIWLAKTTGQPDAHKWALLAPPSTGPKRKAAQKWLKTRKNTSKLQEQLRKQGLLE